MHNAKLNEKKSVLEWVGVKEDFKINEWTIWLILKKQRI
jgi:hypothetical protein